MIENGEDDIHTSVLIFTAFADTSFPLKDESGADKSARVAFKLTIQTDEAADVDSNNADAQVGKALEVAQMVTSWDTPLGRAVQSLEQIMNIVGGLAEVS